MADDEVVVQKLIAEISANAGDAARALAKMEKQLETLARPRETEVTVELDDKKLAKTEAKIDEATRDRTTKVDTETDKKKLVKTEGQIAALGKDRKVEYRPDVNQVDYARVAVQLKGLQGIGANFKGIQGLGAALGTLKIPLALSAGSPLGAGINSLGAGLTALATPLNNVLRGLTAAPALFSQAGTALGVLMVSMSGIGEASSGLKEAMDNLDRAKFIGDPDMIHDAAVELAILREEMKDNLAPAAFRAAEGMIAVTEEASMLQKQMSGEFFSGLNLNILGIVGALEELTPGIRGVSGSLGGMLGDLSDYFVSNQSLGLMSQIFEDTANTIDHMAPGMKNLLQAFQQLAVAGGPFMESFADSFSSGALSLKGWASDTANVQDKLDKASESFSMLWRVIKNGSLALNNTFDAMSGLSDYLYGNIERLSKKWLEWTESAEGQRGIANWGEESKQVLTELGLLIDELGHSFNMLTGEQEMADTIRILRQDFLPTLVEVLEQAKGSGTLEGFADALGGIAVAVSTFAGTSGVLTASLAGLNYLLNTFQNLMMASPELANAIANVATSFGLLKFLGVGGPLAAGIGLISTLMLQLTGDVEGLIPVIIGLGTAFTAMKISKVVTDLGTLRTAMATAAAGASGIGKASAAFGVLAGTTTASAAGSTGATAAMAGLNPAVAAVTATVGVGIAVWQAWSKNNNRVEEESRRLTDTLNNGADVLRSYADAYQNILETRKGTEDAFNKTGIAAGRVTQIVNESSGAFDDARVVWQNFGEEFDKHINWTGAGELKDNLDQIPAAVRPLYEELYALTEAEIITDDQAKKVVDSWADLDKQGQASRMSIESQARAMVQATEGTDVWTQAIDILRKVQDTGNVTNDEAIDLLGEFAFQNEAAAEAAGVLISTLKYQQEEQEELNRIYTEGDADIKRYRDSLQRSVDSGRGWVKSMEDMAMTAGQTRDQLKESGGVMDGHTDAGVKNRDMIRNLYEQYLLLGEAAVESGQSIDGTKGIYGAFEGQIQDLIDNGFIKGFDSAQDLLWALQLLEGNWEVDLQLDTQDKVDLQLQTLQDNLSGLEKDDYIAAVKAYIDGDGGEAVNALFEELAAMKEDPSVSQSITLTEYRKIITLREDGNYGAYSTVPLGPPAPKTGGGSTTSADSADRNNRRDPSKRGANGFLLDFYAKGGLSEQHVAEIAPAGAWRVWAEPETGGEAYIPLATSKRKRSLEIWEETGKRLGAISDAGQYEYYADGGMSTERKFLDGHSPVMARDRTFSPRTRRRGGDTAAEAFKSLWGAMPRNKTVSRTVVETVPVPMPGSIEQSLGQAQGVVEGVNKVVKGLTAAANRMVNAVWNAGINMKITSGRRNSKVAGTNRTSLHAYGRAADMVGDMGGINRFLDANYNELNMQELIYQHRGRYPSGAKYYRKNDHFDHVHGATKFAKGGIVHRPTLGIVGEAGPEAVIPLAKGGVVQYGPQAAMQFFADGGQFQGKSQQEIEAMLIAASTSNSLASSGNSAEKAEYDRIEAERKAQEAAEEAQRKREEAFAKMIEKNTNFFEYLVGKAERSDNDADNIKAIGALMQRSLNFEAWSNEWYSMLTRIESIQAQMAERKLQKEQEALDLAEEKKQNKWDYTFDTADNAVKLRMATEARSTMDAWTDEWLAMTRTIEDLQRQGNGPSVIISELHTHDEADADMLMGKLEWSVRTGRL